MEGAVVKRRRARVGGPDPVDRHVGTRVRTRRTLMGISQERLGELIGLTDIGFSLRQEGAKDIAGEIKQIEGCGPGQCRLVFGAQPQFDAATVGQRAWHGDLLKGCRALRSDRYDLVITDIFMPDQDVLRTIMDIRRDWPALRIIAISGGSCDQLGYLRCAQLLGASQTLMKPFDADQLLAAVRAYAAVRVGKGARVGADVGAASAGMAN